MFFWCEICTESRRPECHSKRVQYTLSTTVNLSKYFDENNQSATYPSSPSSATINIHQSSIPTILIPEQINEIRGKLQQVLW